MVAFHGGIRRSILDESARSPNSESPCQPWTLCQQNVPRTTLGDKEDMVTQRTRKTNFNRVKAYYTPVLILGLANLTWQARNFRAILVRMDGRLLSRSAHTCTSNIYSPLTCVGLQQYHGGLTCFHMSFGGVALVWE